MLPKKWIVAIESHGWKEFKEEERTHPRFREWFLGTKNGPKLKLLGARSFCQLNGKNYFTPHSANDIAVVLRVSGVQAWEDEISTRRA
jgi:hypothetical protein